MSTTPELPTALLQAAEELVKREASIEAVVLFGSRARGEARRGSDYDLAIVSSAAEDEVRRLCKPLKRSTDPVQIVPVHPKALRAYRNTCNRVERAVVVDGLPLAGTWRRPRHRREASDMDHDAFVRQFMSFIAHARAAINEIAAAREDGEIGTNDGAFNAFRAGESAAKAVLTLYGLTPRRVHGVNRLADQLRNARQGALDQDERNALAARIDQLDGNSDELNKLDYTVQIFEPVNATEGRLRLAAELASECVNLYARKATAPTRQPTTPPDAHAQALERIVRRLHGSPKSLRNHPDRSALAEDSNAAIERLCTTAASWSRTEERSPRG